MTELPYHAIGVATVAVSLALLVEAIAVTAAVAFFWSWYRFWTKIVNLAWRGYDVTGDEYPPKWRRVVAIWAYGIKTFKHPREIHKRKQEALQDD
jgi:hypothetical protein